MQDAAQMINSKRKKNISHGINRILCHYLDNAKHDFVQFLETQQAMKDVRIMEWGNFLYNCCTEN